MVANRTIRLSPSEMAHYTSEASALSDHTFSYGMPWNEVFLSSVESFLSACPSAKAQLIIADPPYPGKDKSFHNHYLWNLSRDQYAFWLAPWISDARRVLTSDGVIYICALWSFSSLVEEALRQAGLHIQNRITWHKPKAKRSQSNWTSSHEDIWMASKKKTFPMHMDRVQLHRRNAYLNGTVQVNPSNCWTDLTSPFWHMAENTPHPMQKPEKMMARLILAHTDPAEGVLDLFSGSGTVSVAAYKLGRRFIAVEQDSKHCALIQKRLEMAGQDPSIQGYDGVAFWDRNMKDERTRQVRASLSKGNP